MKHKKSALLKSLLALLLCLSMLVGTTFAWFTDSVATGLNTIAAGNLDVELYHTNAAAQDEKVGAETDLFLDLQGDPILWEPGVVSYENLRVVNAGDLALAYQLSINTAGENYVVDPETGAQYGLSQILEVGFVKGGITATDRAGVVASVEEANWTPLDSFLRGGSLLPENAGEFQETWGVVICWQPGENDNLWNLNNGKTLNEGEALQINLGINLVAVQEQYESDAFGNSYDQQAGFNKAALNVNVSSPVADNAENGVITAPMSVGNASSGVNAEIPAGVALADGATELTLTVKTMDESQADIILENGESKVSMDVHIEGVAEDNTVPMLVTIEGLFAANLNQGNYSMHHVEDGVTVAMTCVSSLSELDTHNEFYYDVATGDVVMCVASFSEYVAVTDNKNLWEGNFDTSWYNTTNTEFTIMNADQLAGFGVLVDEGNTFAGKTVNLGDDIDLAGGYSLNPIGCGYEDSTINSNSVEGRPFKGTFDGQNHTISNLYQNGWEVGLSYCNLGGGLFASIADGTVRNLTITGADIKMECVEMGVLVGLSQGNCIYENIKIYNSKVANYQKATGGLIGEVTGAGTTKISNVTIGSDVVIGSLWGDFDAPVGGVIGARWANGADNQIEMNTVNVACKLDVYNDVTSSYQWYAYRRAGMLIGNTETSAANASGTNVATADFLKCTDVTVLYGGWVDYHYCEFSESYNSPSWPWVRVEAGENCSAFSNPRWGVAKDAENGNPITSIIHSHNNGDEHNVELKFEQLYGGGQGVYGQSEHDGVTTETFDYSVTYMDRGTVFKVDYVKNDAAYTVKHTEYVPTRTESTFKEWVNAGGTKVETIIAGNTTDYVLYDSWHSIYTARFLDQKGNVIYEEEFSTSQNNLNNVPNVPEVDGLIVVGWESYNLKQAKGDIAIKPIYKINDYVQLTPVDEDKDGAPEYYQVTGSTINAENVDIVIPEEVNGIKVKQIITGAFANGDLRDVYVPGSVEKIGKNAFTKDGREFPQIQIIFDGTRAEWDAIPKDAGWDDNIGTGSVIVCTQEDPIGYYQQNGSNGILGWGASVKWGWTQGAPSWYPRSN